MAEREGFSPQRLCNLLPAKVICFKRFGGRRLHFIRCHSTSPHITRYNENSRTILHKFFTNEACPAVDILRHIYAQPVHDGYHRSDSRKSYGISRVQ